MPPNGMASRTSSSIWSGEAEKAPSGRLFCLGCRWWPGAGRCPASCIQANSRGLRGFPGQGRRVRVCGGRCKYVHVSSSPHPCGSCPLKPTPADPPTVRRWPRQKPKCRPMVDTNAGLGSFHGHLHPVEGSAGVGVRDREGTWMCRPSLTGDLRRVPYPHPRRPQPGNPAAHRLSAKTHEAGQSPAPRNRTQSGKPGRARLRAHYCASLAFSSPSSLVGAAPVAGRPRGSTAEM